MISWNQDYYNGRRINSEKARERLERINKELGIVQKSPHKLRKTYGTILLDTGLDNRLVTDVMGHSTIAVTEKSYHRNRKTLDRKCAIVSSIPEFQLPRTS